MGRAVCLDMARPLCMELSSNDDWNTATRRANDSFTQTAIINDCAENSTIVSSMDGVDLQDGQLYWVGVVAYDDWLNANLDDVDVVGVTPFRNTVGSGSAPSRIGIINAFDHAEDDGTAIDVVWSISDAVGILIVAVYLRRIRSRRRAVAIN